MKLLPYSAYKSSELSYINQIPEHWNIVRSKYILREVDERSLYGHETHLSMSQKYGLIPSHTLNEKRLLSENYSGAKLCNKEDIVLNRLKAHLGVFATASMSGLVSPDYTVLRPQQNICSKFFEYLFRTDIYKYEFTKLTKGIVKGFWRLYTDDFYTVKLLVPPLDEQFKIVKYIQCYNYIIKKLISNYKKQISLLKEQKQVIINNAVTKGINNNIKINNSGYKLINKIPYNWKLIKLKYLALKIVSGATPKSDVQNYWDGDITWVTPQDISSNERLKKSKRNISSAGLQSCSAELVPQGSIIVTSRAPVGNVAIADVTLCTNQGCKAIVPNNLLINSEYLFFTLQSINKIFQYFSDGTTFKEISTNAFQNIKIPVPSIEEQYEIISYIKNKISNIDKLIDKIQNQIQVLIEYRDSLILNVVTGKIDVRSIAIPDISDEELSFEMNSPEITDEMNYEEEE